MKQELEFSSMKDKQPLRGDISNKKKPHQTSDSKVKRQQKIFDDYGDCEKLITKLVNAIKFWAKLPSEVNVNRI